MTVSSRQSTNKMHLRTTLIILMILAVILAVVIIVLALDKPRQVIGFTGYDLSLDFFQSMEKGVSEEVSDLGYNYIHYDQAGDETKLVTSFKRLIEQKVDAIIVSPISPEVLPPLVDSAHAANIPVIINDIGGGNSDYDAIVISDNWQGGVLAAEFSALYLTGIEGSREVAIITVEPSAEYASRRGDAYKQTIEASGFEVVAEMSAYSKQEEGYAAMQLILTEHPNLVAVFAENDPMAVGAANAIAEAGRKDILIVGFNGDKIARDAIAAGLMQATVAQNPTEMGRITAKLADRLINGQTIVFDDPDKREIYVPVEMITINNID